MTDTNYRVGFIGTGRPYQTEGSTGFGMAHMHADGYVKTGRCTLAACADLEETVADAFADKYGIPKRYTDYHEMLANEALDIISVCTWPEAHASIVIDTARTGVKAIHCEKPMATTWGDAREMARVCNENGVKLTFNHQRRFLLSFQTAKKLLDEGALGKLMSMQGNCGDLYDWGTHWLNMFFYYHNETPATWVMAQIDSRKDHTIFGVPMENQGLCEFRFSDGVRAILTTGTDSHEPAAHRLIGTEGILEVCWDEKYVRLLNGATGGWQTIGQPDDLHSWIGIDRAIASVVDAVATGQESILSAKNTLQSTEIIFAAYESSRRRARIDLPLTVDDNAFLTMLNDGLIGPEREIDESAGKKQG
ncbi:MAG: Gfo/Idh/MocA family protein [Janthinobacterium lividum]